MASRSIIAAIARRTCTSWNGFLLLVEGDVVEPVDGNVLAVTLLGESFSDSKLDQSGYSSMSI